MMATAKISLMGTSAVAGLVLQEPTANTMSTNASVTRVEMGPLALMESTLTVASVNRALPVPIAKRISTSAPAILAQMEANALTW